MNYETALQRAAIVQRIRDFFRSRDVLEITTPVLSHCSPTDCHIDVLSTDYHPSGSRDTARSETMFMRTSPEFHMKRLLAAGYRDMFQIGPVFRDGELGKLHNPEFTMLEWYRSGMSMDGLINETAEIFAAVLGRKTVRKKSYAEIFVETTGIDPLSTDRQAIELLCRARGVSAPAFDTLTDALQFAMSAIVEPQLPRDEFFFVYHYPAEQAVLAMLEPDNPRVARRFEVYYGGCELVNGFEELGDWQENEQRQRQENLRRRAAGKAELPLDNQFIAALKNGMPSCSGAALGLDRLVMLASGKTNIAEVLTFPWKTC